MTPSVLFLTYSVLQYILNRKAAFWVSICTITVVAYFPLTAHPQEFYSLLEEYPARFMFTKVRYDHSRDYLIHGI